MSTLRTDFSGAFDSGLFAKTETTGTVTQTGGEIIFTGASSAGICYVTDQTAVDITAGDDFAVKLAGTTPPWPCIFWLAVLDSVGRGFAIRVGGPGVNLFHVGTCTTGIASYSPILNYGDFDISVHVYLRCRYASGTAYFDYSTDGSSWTNRRSDAVPSGFDPTTVKGWFGQFDSNAADVWKVTDYYAPTLSGGGLVARPWITG